MIDSNTKELTAMLHVLDDLTAKNISLCRAADLLNILHHQLPAFNNQWDVEFDLYNLDLESAGIASDFKPIPASAEHSGVASDAIKHLAKLVRARLVKHANDKGDQPPV